MYVASVSILRHINCYCTIMQQAIVNGKTVNTTSIIIVCCDAILSIILKLAILDCASSDDAFGENSCFGCFYTIKYAIVDSNSVDCSVFYNVNIIIGVVFELAVAQSKGLCSCTFCIERSFCQVATVESNTIEGSRCHDT